MTKPVKLLGIAGSLSKTSRNRAVLETLRDRVSPAAILEIQDLADVPLYDPDLDNEVPPQGVIDLRRKIGEADALIIATPEYNYGMPGVLKNALDWASRPAFQSTMVGKPVGVLSVSPAFTGGVRAQQDLKYTLSGVLSIVVPHREVVIGEAGNKIEDDRLTDAKALEALDAMVAAVVSFTKSHAVERPR